MLILYLDASAWAKRYTGEIGAHVHVMEKIFDEFINSDQVELVSRLDDVRRLFGG